MNHVMLDLETLGTTPGSMLLSIGAVRFDLDTFEVDVDNKFSINVDPCTQSHFGLTIDPGTVMWWLDQSLEARTEVLKPGSSLQSALVEFADWLGAGDDGTNPDVQVWGNGAAFDNALLNEAYRRAGIVTPWKFWNDRCYRTIKGMHPDRKLVNHPGGTAHVAVDDAVVQATHLCEIVAWLKHGAR